ncbi:nitronate monooxygenase [Clostridiaceae bacterium UIB06]|uniref:Nitronate monooxygenase n=1 Tax=Clostridium thailandense TaxID=2794346 RepID=A0A949WQW1_9CLOT|nr:nitronate monooxygenase family protein [Clostridium thailandense]MBV7273260.1 nitronate monooxygenase [Clostridium thailandense]MCH5137285.1 nitronate monooxygenase [Clostridiaceae bacterium UIB06]
MKLPPLIIGDLKAEVPIIQGGMGVGVSGYRLASAVANEGAIGIISSVQIGYREEDFQTNTKEANIRALKKEIKKARELSPNGIIGVNIMVAITDYDEEVKACVEEQVDLIISGAGLPLALPKLVEGSNTKIAPIASSGKSASVITKHWIKKYKRVPDVVVVEGPEAGGHLGFHPEEVRNNKLKLEEIVVEVIEALKPFEEEYDTKIPVVAAGGIYTGEDIAKFIKMGAAGVQMATRFVATEECDAHIDFKKSYINSKKEDIRIIQSPVGLPGRAIENDFIKQVERERIKPNKCFNCLKKCDPKNTPYCISKALIEAVKGNVNDGLIFSGSSAYRIDKIVTVKELIKELTTDAEKSLTDD